MISPTNLVYLPFRLSACMSRSLDAVAKKKKSMVMMMLKGCFRNSIGMKMEEEEEEKRGGKGRKEGRGGYGKHNK